MAHQYDLKLILQWCTQALERATLDVLPSTPIALSAVASHPGLIQWLALADQKQSRPMVKACLDKLFHVSHGEGSAPMQDVKKALTSECLRKMVGEDCVQ